MGGEDAEVRKLGVDAAVRRPACRPRCARAHIRTHPAMTDGGMPAERFIRRLPLLASTALGGWHVVTTMR